jgi:hypothetical protein
MGTNQSSLAKSASSEKKEKIPELKVKLVGEGGRSVNQDGNIIHISHGEFETESDSEYESSDDESVDEEETAERLRILEDAQNLKALAVAYLHPELPVVTSDPTAFARCYFDRASAPEQEDMEEIEYRRQVLEDAAALKQLAVDYAHPELPVVTSDPTATARCYFDRASAPQPNSSPVHAAKSVEPAAVAPKKVIEKIPAYDSQSAVKTLDTSKSSDIVRSLSSVKLFGLDGDGDASY